MAQVYATRKIFFALADVEPWLRAIIDEQLDEAVSTGFFAVMRHGEFSDLRKILLGAWALMQPCSCRDLNLGISLSIRLSQDTIQHSQVCDHLARIVDATIGYLQPRGVHFMRGQGSGFPVSVVVAFESASSVEITEGAGLFAQILPNLDITTDLVDVAS